MTFTLEVEQDGSLTLSQEVVSETLHLSPGAKVSVKIEPGGSMVSLQPVESEGEEYPGSRLYWKNGWLVYDGPSDPPFDAVGAIHEMREERIRKLAERSGMNPDA